MSGDPEADLVRQASAELDRGQLEQAEALFRQVLEANGDQVDALVGMGSIALRVGNLEAADQFLAAADGPPARTSR